LAEYVGYRTQKRMQQKNKKHKLWKWLVALAVLIAIFVILGAGLHVAPFDKAWHKTAGGFTWLGRQIKSAWPFKSSKKVVAADFLPEGKKTANYLVSITKQIGGATFQSTVVLASYDSKTKTGSLIFLPNDLLVNTPGMGTDQLSNLVETDDQKISSTLVTVENVLGTEVDRYVMATDRDLRIILKQLGDKFVVNVASRVSFKDPSLGVTIDLKPGRQALDATKLASYLTYCAPGNEVDLAKIQADYAPQFLAMLRGVDSAKFMAKNANMFDTDASNKELAGMLNAYTSLKGGNLQPVVLPVKEFKFEKTVVHRVDTAALPAFVKKYVKSGSTLSTTKRIRIELLNGCGVPGIGAKASSHIDLAKFQVVNSGNADNFNHPDTVIIVYGNDPEIVAAAGELRNELEVGTVQLQQSSQTVTDISVIIGKDFANK